MPTIWKWQDTPQGNHTTKPCAGFEQNHGPKLSPTCKLFPKLWQPANPAPNQPIRWKTWRQHQNPQSNQNAPKAARDYTSNAGVNLSSPEALGDGLTRIWQNYYRRATTDKKIPESKATTVVNPLRDEKTSTPVKHPHPTPEERTQRGIPTPALEPLRHYRSNQIRAMHNAGSKYHRKIEHRRRTSWTPTTLITQRKSYVQSRRLQPIAGILMDRTQKMNPTSPANTCHTNVDPPTTHPQSATSPRTDNHPRI